jgi:hypothetical protein
LIYSVFPIGTFGAETRRLRQGQIVRFSRVSRQVSLPNFAAALDAIENLLRFEIGNDAADGDLLTVKDAETALSVRLTVAINAPIWSTPILFFPT